jgi:hypothetical protein
MLDGKDMSPLVENLHGDTSLQATSCKGWSHF